MPLETGECNGACEGEFEGKVAVDAVAQGGEKRSGECNGIACGEAEDVDGVAKDYVDGSYVFVNGESDEPTKGDLDVVDKADLAGNQHAESRVETDAISEGDLGEGSREETRISEVEISVAENGALSPNGDAEVEERPFECKESSDQSEDKGDLVLSTKELSHSKEENGEMIVENGHICEESGAPNLDSDVGTLNIREETSVTDMIVGQHVPDPVTEIEDKASCMSQECGESFVEVVCNHDGLHGEAIVNGEVEGQGDDESTVATTSETEDKDSEVVVTETAVSASLSPVNGNEIVPSNAEERIPEAAQSVENKEMAASSDTGDSPAAEQAEIVVTERSDSESLPLISGEALVTLNSEEDIQAVEQCALSRMEPESESRSRIELGDKSYENSERMPIHTIDDEKSKADEGNIAQEISERKPSPPVESPEAGGEATEVLVNSPESSNIGPIDDKLKVSEESVENREDASSCSANDMDSRTMIEEVSNEDKIYPSSPTNGKESQAEVITSSLKSQDFVSACPEVETRLEGSEKNSSAIPDNDTAPVTEDSPPIVEISKDAFSNVDDVKLESEVGSGPVEHGESTIDSIKEIQSAERDDTDRLTSAGDNATERGPENGVSPAPMDESGTLSLLGQKVDTDAKHLPCFMVRVPRFSDDKLRMLIQRAQQEVDEKTTSRDSIRVSMQKQKAVCTEYWRKVEDARKEERAARDAVASKRQEIDSIQSILSKLKNATSISDIDSRIHNLQQRISHETNTLKEEKLLIREMNQLKQSREHLSSSLASEEELQDAFEKQEQMETSLQHLKEEVDTLRKDVLRAEGSTKDARTRYEDQCECLRDLQTKFKAADDLRQEAYINLKNLKKESYVKNEYFYSYKDDMKVATNFAFSRDREALLCHCTNQVEKIMELWNKNDEFRHQYVKSNVPSTVRRFKTLDGRSLGPDEEPVVIHNMTEQKENIVSEKKENIISQPLSKSNTPVLVVERKREQGDAPLSVAKMHLADSPIVAQKSQSQKSKKVTKPIAKEAVSNGEDNKVEAEKETKRTVEEEELARKLEELAQKEEGLRKAKEAAELKEKLRLEQIAKAKEAEERKKRKTEKAQVKAEIRAQKEAELREKKKGKKERKKERKATATNTEIPCETEVPAPAAGNPPEIVQEQPERMTSTTSKRPSRSWAAMKDYSKIKPLPLPLRNKGKRKMQTWMWVFLAALVIFALFVAGNYISSSGFGLRNLSF
uniref:Cingulin n=1 Tax=Anthurium amnicola TaxID=1678845 RepID=A0A1D1XS90_9ARAE